MPAGTYVGLRPMYKCAIVPAKPFDLLSPPLVACGIPATGHAARMKQTTPARPFAILRAISNIAALVIVLLGLDWLYAAWHGGSTYACSATMALGSEASLTVIGMGGLVIAIIGITLGGVRHPITVVALVTSVASSILAAIPISSLCG